MIKDGTSAKRERAVTAEAFERLLGWLDPDRERAGEKYEEIRRKIVKIFIYRGCQEADDLADEVINRVTERAEVVAVNYTGDPALYFYGVAQNVHREYLRRWRSELQLPSARARSSEPRAAAPQVFVAPAEDKERRHACLEDCLRQLPEEDRELIVQYYAEEKQVKIERRKELAAGLHLLPNTLRRRTQRLRERLKECISRCLERAEASSIT